MKKLFKNSIPSLKIMKSSPKTPLINVLPPISLKYLVLILLTKIVGNI